MASIAQSNNENTIVIGHNDAEHAPGLHQRRHGAHEMEQHSSSGPDTSSPDVEAAICSNPGDGKDSGTPAADAADQQQVEQYADVSYADIAKQFSILGWTAFGGPAAHIGMFQRVSSSIAQSLRRHIIDMISSLIDLPTAAAAALHNICVALSSFSCSSSQNHCAGNWMVDA
jgi:hypothetical protein